MGGTALALAVHSMVMLLLCPQGSQSLASVITLGAAMWGWAGTWAPSQCAGMDPEQDACPTATPFGCWSRDKQGWQGCCHLHIPMACAHPARPEGLLAPTPGRHTISQQGSAVLQRLWDVLACHLSSHNHGMLEGALKIIPSIPCHSRDTFH